MVGRDARPVGDADQGDLGLVPAVGDAAYDLLLHDLALIHHQRARLIGEAGQHLKPDLVLHRQGDRAGLEDLGAQRGHLEHLLVGDAVQLARLGDNSGVGGVYPFDIGKNITAMRAERRRQRHRREIRSAAAERGHPALRRDALEARHDDDLPLVEAGAQLLGAERADARPAMARVGAERRLPAEDRARRHADRLQRQGQQAGGDLLARGDHGVVLGAVVLRAGDLPTQSISRSVVPAIAETTAATCSPRSARCCTRCATARRRSRSATEVPPNFCTTSVMTLISCRPRPPPRRQNQLSGCGVFSDGLFIRSGAV